MISYFPKCSIVEAWEGSENAYVSEYPRVLKSPGFWICLWFWMCQNFEYTRLLSMPLVSNIPGFWLWQCSEYVRVTQGSEYAWIIPEYAWLCLNISECAWICLNMHEYAFCPNQHLTSKGIKQTINFRRIALISYWCTVQCIMTWLQQQKTNCTSRTKTPHNRAKLD